MRYKTIMSPKLISSNAKNLYLTAPGIIVGKPMDSPIAANRESPHEAHPVKIRANILPIQANKEPLVLLLLMEKLMSEILIVNEDKRLINIFNSKVDIKTPLPKACAKVLYD